MRAMAGRATKVLRLPLLAAVAAAVAYLAWMGLDGTIAGFEHPRLPMLETRDLGDAVLVVSPHPDDETLAAGGLVRQSLEAGKRVRVVVVTGGDGFKRIVGDYGSANATSSPYLHLGATRAKESRRAMVALGLAPRDLVFLGYPDGSLESIWSGDWDPSRPKTGVNGVSAVPYSFAYRPGAPYSGSSIASDLASIVASFSPTAVVFPDGEDANPDHWAVGAFTELTLDRLGYRGGRYTYLVHRGHFPFPWSYVPNGWILPPRTMQGLGTEWLSLELSRRDESEKERAVAAYASQRRAMAPFVSSFVRRNELFGRLRPPTVRHSAEVPSLDATAMPGVVVQDPAADTLLRVVDAGGDIRQVAIVRNTDAVWLGLETRGSIVPAIAYRVSLRLLSPLSTTTRLDLQVRGGRATALKTGRDSVAPEALQAGVRGRRMWVRLPVTLFTGATEGIVSAETHQSGLVLDRTAWRRFLIR